MFLIGAKREACAGNNMTETEARRLLAGLTAKQIEVLDLLLQHQTTKEMARNLDLAPSTVDQRIGAVREKWETIDRKATARRYAEILAAIEEGQGAPPIARDTAEPDDIADAGANWSAPKGRRLEIERLDRHLGNLGRVALIAFIAVAIAMLLATTLGVANALEQLMGP